VSVTIDCTAKCEAEATCTVCKRRKPPVGRDTGVYAASNYCEHECPGNRLPPHPGHLLPGELARSRSRG
jgi:hypothetical protein